MQRARKLLDLLYARRDGWTSRGEMASVAGVSERRVDAAVALLRQRGHAIDARSGLGLRLTEPVRMDAWLIERGLDTRRVGRSVICFDEVASTNDVAFASARQQNVDGLVIVAEHQSAGRGRAGRKWHSPPGANVLLSALLTGDELPPAGAITIAAGLAAAEAAEGACGASCRLKWPNDVMLDGAKVAGVLVEQRSASGLPAVVVGIGMNANACPPPADVHHPAGTLADALGRPIDRIDLARQVIARLDLWVALACDGQTELIRRSWRQRCDLLGRRITVRCAGRMHVGRALDVSPFDELVIEDDAGRRVSLPAAGSTVHAVE
jgi:BirA family biotin operon repressor/biotin-[acetyl-CoA-carboxylase] ligase